RPRSARLRDRSAPGRGSTCRSRAVLRSVAPDRLWPRMSLAGAPSRLVPCRKRDDQPRARPAVAAVECLERTEMRFGDGARDGKAKAAVPSPAFLLGPQGMKALEHLLSR